MARQKQVLESRPVQEKRKLALEHIQAALEDVELLVHDSEHTSRSSWPYVEAYHATSPLLQLPIPSEAPTFDPEKPLDLGKGPRSPVKAKGGEGDLSAPKHTALPRFQGVNARASPILPPTAASRDLNDVVFYAGGPIWAMDWCPALPDAEGNEISYQYIAVGAHGKGQEQHAMGKPTEGPGMVQIWEVQHQPSGGRGVATPPRLVLGICHDRGAVWALQWCPQADEIDADGSASLSRIGLLAVLYGDGQLEVLAVPTPDSLANLGATDMDVDQAPGSSGNDQPAVGSTVYVRLKPQASAAAISNDCLGSCLDWLPSTPHDLLLIGHWDGTVAVWRIPPQGSWDKGAGGRELQLLSHFMADVLAPLRSVCWAPPRIAEGTTDMSQRHIFVTAGHSGTLKMWDSRDPFLPALESQSNVAWIQEAIWLAHPDGILFCQDDGAFKFLELSSQHRPEHERSREKVQTAWWGPTRGGLWSCHVSPTSGYVAYAGEGGTVAVAPPEFQHRVRHPRPPHIVVSRTRWENNLVICMRGQEDPSPTFGMKPLATKGEVGDGMSAIHKVRWSNGQAKDPQAAWLASGGESGIVRCQRISLYVVF